jgi:hypothetical protein
MVDRKDIYYPVYCDNCKVRVCFVNEAHLMWVSRTFFCLNCESFFHEGYRRSDSPIAYPMLSGYHQKSKD